MVRKSGGLNITIIVQDEDWRKLGTWKWNNSDSKRRSQIISTLEDKGVSFKVDRDLDWAI